MPTRAPYEGTERKLVLAFDVGATYSGISYTYVESDNLSLLRHS